MCEARDYQSSTYKKPHVFEYFSETIINLWDAKDSKLNKWVEKESASIIKMNRIEIDYSEESVFILKTELEKLTFSNNLNDI